MTYTAADLESAIDKLSTLEFNSAETEAVADAIARTDEVEGFAAGRRPGQGFLLEISGFLMPQPGSVGPKDKSFTATDDLTR